MMFAEDYLEFNETEAQAEADSGLPSLCKCGELSQDCDCDKEEERQRWNSKSAITLVAPDHSSMEKLDYWYRRAKTLLAGDIVIISRK
jgi:hypothetical protein